MVNTTSTETGNSSSIKKSAEVNDKLWLTSFGRFLIIVWTTGCVLIIANFLLHVEQDISVMENDWRLHLPSGGTSSAIAEERRGNVGILNEVETNGYWKKEVTEGESEEEEQWEDKTAEQTESGAAAEKGPSISKLPNHILILA